MKFTKNMYKTVIILMLILIMPTVICDVVIPDIYQDDYLEPPYDEPAEDNTSNDALPEDIPADGDTPNDKPSDDVPLEDSTPNDKPVDDVPSDVEKPTDTPSDDDFSEDETPDDDTPTDKPSDDVPPNDDIPPEDDSEESEPEDIEFLNPDYTITGLPEFVSNISECKNKKKKYVLPDGYIYEYKLFFWTKTEKYVPADWHQEIKDTIEKIDKLDLPDESNVIKFMFASDIHVGPDPSTSYTKNLGKVCAEVMRVCKIPFFATGGDNCTQSSEFMPTVFTDNMKVVLEQLSPIPQKNILLSVGNHDGETGVCEYNGQMVYYRFQLNNEQRSEVFFGWQRETNENKKFDPDGTYYYMDDPTTKTRYIILNSFWSKWAGDEDGFVHDIQHSFGHTPIFGPQQLKWFAEKALDMPTEYGAVLVVHFAPDARDFKVFKGIVDAFSSKSSYTGSYIGVKDWQSTHISVNYENSKGEIIAVFQGHHHKNIQYDYFESIPCINITTAGAFWAVRDENPVKRVKGTSTEFAVDVVVIDRVNRKIYLTRLGAGDDRVIEY